MPSVYYMFEGIWLLAVQVITDGVTISSYIEGISRKRVSLDGDFVFYGHDFENISGIEGNLAAKIIFNGETIYFSLLLKKAMPNNGEHFIKVKGFVDDDFNTLESNWETENNIMYAESTTAILEETSIIDKYTLITEANLTFEQAENQAYVDTLYYYVCETKTFNGAQWEYELYRNVLHLPYDGFTLDRDGNYSKPIHTPQVTITQEYPARDVKKVLAFLSLKTTTDNYFTALQAKGISKLLIIQKSDAKRPNALNKATICNMSLKYLIETFKQIFNCEYDLNGGEIRFKHYLDFALLASDIDFSNYKDKNWCENSGDCERISLPSKMVWKFEDSRNFTQFIKLNDLYDNESVQYNIETVNNDLTYLSRNPEEANDEGICIVATDEDRKILNGEIGGLFMLNYKMNQEQIFEDFWHNRETIKQPDLLAPISPLDIDYTHYVNTSESELSIIKKAEMPVNGGLTKLTITQL